MGYKGSMCSRWGCLLHISDRALGSVKESTKPSDTAAPLPFPEPPGEGGSVRHGHTHQSQPASSLTCAAGVQIVPQTKSLPGGQRWHHLQHSDCPDPGNAALLTSRPTLLPKCCSVAFYRNESLPSFSCKVPWTLPVSQGRERTDCSWSQMYLRWLCSVSHSPASQVPALSSSASFPENRDPLQYLPTQFL